MAFKQSRDPIIIFGAPRSGTTYLHSILNEHPDVYISHEARLFGWLHQSFKVITNKDDFLVTHREEFMEHLRVSYPKLIRNFYSKLKPQARYWGDKNPLSLTTANVGTLQTIVELFPGAKFIHIIRDGRDVVASLTRRHHSNGEPWADFLTAHHLWNGHIERGTVFSKTQAAEKYFELRYEDLIRDDLGMAVKLFQFLQIPMVDSVARFCESQQEKRTPFSLPTRDITNVAASDWSKVFDADQQCRSLKLIGANLIACGYETAPTLAAKLKKSPKKEGAQGRTSPARGVRQNAPRAARKLQR